MSTTSLRSDNAVPVAPSSSRLHPLAVGSVTLRGGFWGDLQQLNTAEILPHSLGWVERLGWVGNFESAAGDAPYEHRGKEFADSEIYKLVEALSWDVARGAEPAYADALDRLITLIERAQDPDGYLHTRFGRPWQSPRYFDFKWGHELYCFGHLIQAAVANHRATGDDRLLAVARRLADHVCMMFGATGLDRVCGHAEIEVALAELGRLTGEPRYLEQASIFIERRGTGTLPLFEFGTAYWQDDQLVREATVLRGHAVRALYLAAGAVDVAVETDDHELLAALVTQWDRTVATRTYLTGGMGSHHMDEAFGDDFVLPPDRSYCETCAGVASIMFSWRLLLATGEAKYSDLIERTLYNIVATSPAADGHAFFYANTLHQRVEHALPSLNDDGVVIRGGASGRQPWFEVSCCPPNVARMLASFGAYAATGTEDALEIHQFVSGDIVIGGTSIRVETAYPNEGLVRVIVNSTAGESVDIAIRVPGWSVGGRVLRGNSARDVTHGYAQVHGLKAGDSFDLELPLEVRVTRPDERIDAVRGTVAFERGPEVFALESVDLPTGVTLDEVRYAGSARYVDGTISIEVATTSLDDTPWPYSSDAPVSSSATTFVPLVRYHSWAERGPSTMRIWIPERN